MNVESIVFQGEDGEELELYCMEQVRFQGKNYILVSENMDEDGECFFMEDSSSDEDIESNYIPVDNEELIMSLVELFESEMDEVTFDIE